MQQQPSAPPQQPPQTVLTPAPALVQPQPTRIRRLKSRNMMFKVGFGGVVLAAVIFIVGYSAPAWANRLGLWLTCSGSQCYENTGYGPGWLDAVRSMETLALVCFLACIAVELYQDVFKQPPPRDNRAVEILAAAAGVFGLIGIAIVGAKLDTTYNGYDYYYKRIYLQWGFGLAAAGSILVILCSIAIAVGRKKQPSANYSAHTASYASHPTIPIQPMMSPPAGYPYMPAYPYPYPPPTATLITAPALAVPLVAAQGMSASQVPDCYVMVQGQMVPIYKQMPSTMLSTTTTAPEAATGQHVIPEESVDGRPSNKL